jgi:hypothetical protein
MDVEFLRRRLGLTSGGASLALLRQRLERAEAELEAARAAMRSAADAAGIERTGLFSESEFIPRSTGDSWFEAGKREGAREITDCMLRARGLDPEEERAKVAASIKRDRKAAEARSARWDALMRDAGWHDAVDAGDHARAGRIMFEMHDVLTQADAHVMPRHVVERMEREHPTGKTKADQILRAGRRARMSADEAGEIAQPDKGSLAAQIIRAGQRRRGEIE